MDYLGKIIPSILTGPGLTFLHRDLPVGMTPTSGRNTGSGKNIIDTRWVMIHWGKCGGGFCSVRKNTFSLKDSKSLDQKWEASSLPSWVGGIVWDWEKLERDEVGKMEWQMWILQLPSRAHSRPLGREALFRWSGVDWLILVNMCPAEEPKVTVCRLLLLWGSDKALLSWDRSPRQKRGMPLYLLYKIQASSQGRTRSLGERAQPRVLTTGREQRGGDQLAEGRPAKPWFSQ